MKITELQFYGKLKPRYLNRLAQWHRISSSAEDTQRPRASQLSICMTQLIPRTVYQIGIIISHSENGNIKENLTCSFSSSSLLSLRSSSSILKEGTKRYRYLENSREFSTKIPVLEQCFSNECIRFTN